MIVWQEWYRSVVSKLDIHVKERSYCAQVQFMIEYKYYAFLYWSTRYQGKRVSIVVRLYSEHMIYASA
jgi:hypothetical protein